MKTSYRFIQFVEDGPLWACLDKTYHENMLGFCEWYSKWKQWQFVPDPHTAFTQDCLQDIAHFLNQLPKK